MRFHRFIFIIGLLVIITPFLGIPSGARTVVQVVLGSLLVIGGTLIKLKHIRQAHADMKKDDHQTFVEHNPQQIPMESTDRQSSMATSPTDTHEQATN